VPTPHPHPWHRDSVFGDGPRRPLDREQRARFRYLLSAHRRARRLTPRAELVGDALVRRLGVDGRLDPSHHRLAEDVGYGSRTVRWALAALKAVGLIMWRCRVVRDGWAVRQTSNAYVLALSAVGTLPTPVCGGQSGRETKSLIYQRLNFLLATPGPTQQEALKGLAAIAAGRMLALGLA
jgi:hypothetical protein